MNGMWVDMYDVCAACVCMYVGLYVVCVVSMR